MASSVVPTVIAVVVLVVGLTVMFVVKTMRTAAGDRRRREALEQLGLRVGEGERLCGVGTRGGRDVAVELGGLVELRGRRAPYGARVSARAVLPVPVLLLVSRDVREGEWPLLQEKYLKHDPRTLAEVTTGDARFDASFRTFVRDRARIPFVDDAKLRDALVELWAGGDGLVTLETGGAEVDLIVEADPGRASTLAPSLDLAVALASLRA